jgi:hypothetical protein
VLDGTSDYAKQRALAEQPQVEFESSAVYRSFRTAFDNVEAHTPTLDIRFTALPLPMWSAVLDDVAYMEPYSFGRAPRAGAMFLGSATPVIKSFAPELIELLASHFEELRNAAESKDLEEMRDGILADRSAYDTLDYVLSKEYETILRRRDMPLSKKSRVQAQMFNEDGVLDPMVSLAKLTGELGELWSAAAGTHLNETRGKKITSRIFNVRRELGDYIFGLMVLDVALGGDGYEGRRWAAPFEEGRRSNQSTAETNIQDIISGLPGLITRGKHVAARAELPKLVELGGSIASRYHVGLTAMVAEIETPQRWRR